MPTSSVTLAHVKSIARKFRIDATLRSLKRLGAGRINDTFVSTWESPTGVERHVHQRINQAVFSDPAAVMANLERVLAHLHERITAEGGDPALESLTLVPARDGAPFLRDETGVWRTLLYVERMTAHEGAIDRATARKVGFAYGQFQQRMSDLPEPRLIETIPGFHHTPGRYDALQAAAAQDPAGRVKGARAELDFVNDRTFGIPVVADLLQTGALPVRVVHNDTKINNVLVDSETGRCCVIDLDTVMPGTLLSDFGDMVRSAAATAGEEERDPAAIGISLDLFEELAEGYLDAGRSFLSPPEIGLLPFSVWQITLEQGMRFLTDYLLGDRYYPVRRRNQNLDRCRNQFALVKGIEAAMDEMKAIVERCGEKTVNRGQ
jgi:hypothetical protein